MFENADPHFPQAKLRGLKVLPPHRVWVTEPSSVLLIKAAVESIAFTGMNNVGSGSILGRRLIVGYGLPTMPDVLIIVGDEIRIKPVPVFGLTGLDGFVRCISRFLVFIFVTVFVRIPLRL